MGRAKQRSTRGGASGSAPAASPQPSPPAAGPDRYDGASFLGNPTSDVPSVSPDIATSRVESRS